MTSTAKAAVRAETHTPFCVIEDDKKPSGSTSRESGFVSGLSKSTPSVQLEESASSDIFGKRRVVYMSDLDEGIPGRGKRICSTLIHTLERLLGKKNLSYGELCSALNHPLFNKLLDAEGVALREVLDFLMTNARLLGTQTRMSRTAKQIVVDILEKSSYPSLAREIGEGGEASIYEIAGRVDLVVKVRKDGGSYTEEDTEIELIPERLRSCLLGECVVEVPAYMADEGAPLSDREELLLSPWLIEDLEAACKEDESLVVFDEDEGKPIETTQRVGIVMPRAETSMDMSWSKNVGLNRRLKDVYEVAKCLKSYGAVHRDLKPANVLKVDGKWKLSDLSMTRKIGDRGPAQDITVLYGISPEITQATSRENPDPLKEITYTSKMDIWSLGIMLFEAVIGEVPSIGENNLSIVNLIATGQYYDLMFPDLKLLEAEWRQTADQALLNWKEMYFGEEFSKVSEVDTKINEYMEQLAIMEAKKSEQASADSADTPEKMSPLLIKFEINSLKLIKEQMQSIEASMKSIGPIFEKEFGEISSDDLNKLDEFVYRRSRETVDCHAIYDAMKKALSVALQKRKYYEAFLGRDDLKEVTQCLLAQEPKDRPTPPEAVTMLESVLKVD